MLSKLLSWFDRLVSWLAEPYRGWLCLLTILAAAAYATWFPVSEFRIRGTGLVLQILGIGTAAYSIRDIRKRFRHDGSIEQLLAWLSRFPKWHRPVVIITGTGALGIASSSARAEVWGNVNPAASTQEMLTVMLSNVERLRERIRSLENDLDTTKDRFVEELRTETEARSQADLGLSKETEGAHTGGLTVGIIGVLWLLVGTVLSTLAPEITRWSA